MYTYRLERPSKLIPELPSPPSQPIFTLFSGAERPLYQAPPMAIMGETLATESCPSQKQMDQDMLSEPRMDGFSPGQVDNNSSRQLEIDEMGIENGVRPDAQSEFATGFPLVCLMVGLMVAQFLVSIDRTIISTVS